MASRIKVVPIGHTTVAYAKTRNEAYAYAEAVETFTPRVVTVREVPPVSKGAVAYGYKWAVEVRKG